MYAITQLMTAFNNSILCRFNSSYYLLKCTLFNKVKLNNVIERNYEKKYLKNIQRNCSINR